VAEVDLGAIRQRILHLAVAASRDREPQKRFSVKGLFRVHLRARYDPTDSATIDSEPAVTEAEIFQAAYGDPLGRDYWRAWLSEPFHRLRVADLIATHAAPSEPLFQCTEAQILSALFTANFANTSSAIGWLIFTPHIAHLVPASLCDYLSGAEAPTAAAAEETRNRPFPAATESTRRQEGADQPQRPLLLRRRGPEPKVFRRVIDKMKAMSETELAAMKIVEMAAVFEASSDTCRRARLDVLPKK
jgi:hypothetical protein